MRAENGNPGENIADMGDLIQRRIHVNGVTLNDETKVIDLAAKIAANNGRVNHIVFENSVIRESIAEILLSRCARDLQIVEFRGVPFAAAADMWGSAVVRALAAMPRLQAVVFDHIKYPMLPMLEFLGDWISDAETPCTLQLLAFHACGVDYGLADFSSALVVNKSLVALEITGDSIGNEAGGFLNGAVRDHASLESVDLSGTVLAPGLESMFVSRHPGEYKPVFKFVAGRVRRQTI